MAIINTQPALDAMPGSPTQRAPGYGNTVYVLASIVAATLTGCAAFTNPVANGVPVRLLPEELLAESRENYESINLALLRQEPPEAFLLDTGDTLGIYIEGIIGDESTPPPVNLPASNDMPPAIGYPFPIRGDGTISLPLAGSVKVAGMTIEEAEQAVVDAYLEDQIIRPDDFRIIVTLLRPRTVRVLVVREDNSTPGVTVRSTSIRGFAAGSTTIGGGTQPTGNALELPIYENDLLNALTSTGGLPSEISTKEIIIYRGYASGDSVSGCYACELPDATDLPSELSDGEQRIIRIPIRKLCSEQVDIPRDDIILQDGDIIRVQAREPEVYYTGGLLPPSEQALPIDYDLSVVEAVLRSTGPLVSGGIQGNNLQGNIVGQGLGNPSPRLLTVLRKTPRGQQVNIRIDLNDALTDPRQNILVMNGDILILQENRDQALARYFFNSVFQLDGFFRILNRGDAQGSASIVLP